MVKLIFMAVVGLAIWGGLSGAFNIENKDGSISVNIDKEKAIESFENGLDKAKEKVEDLK